MEEESTFDQQFPIGLPVGLTKPNLHISYIKGKQYVIWQETNEITVLDGSVFPHFCLCDLERWVQTERLDSFNNPTLIVDSFSTKSWSIMYNLCQTDTEKRFFKEYTIKFVMPYKQYDYHQKSWSLSWEPIEDTVPAPVPQVWIQWNNQALKNLNRAAYEDGSLYRVDFAIFWNSKVYIILLDGIQHYAKQQYNRWDADEEKYATRLKEDRWLRLQGWEVFRISNWEIKDNNRRNQVFDELREFIDFPEPPMPQVITTEDDEDIPF